MYIKFNNARPIIESNCGLIKRRFQELKKSLSIAQTKSIYSEQGSPNLIFFIHIALTPYIDIVILISVELDEN